MDNERRRVKEKEPAVARCLIKTLSILIYSIGNACLDHYNHYRLENIIDIARIIIDVKIYSLISLVYLIIYVNVITYLLPDRKIEIMWE